MNKTIQAKNIQDDEILVMLDRKEWTSRFTIEARLPHYPSKVVMAKLRSLHKRKKIDGCSCGCRGDFTLI